MNGERRAHAVVVGGGLAGLAAALDCADAGLRVTVLERRRRLGGLTWSFRHGDHSVDNGQHVFLRCCDAYLGFLARIGSAADVALQDRLDITVLRAARGPDGAPATGRLHRSGAPAPLHLAGALARYPHLPLADRLRLGHAAFALRRLDLDDPRLDDETFGAWLARHGQSPAAIERLWDLITVATVNLPASQASLAMGAKVFQTGLLTDAAAADIGWATIPLGDLHGRRAGEALARAGAEVRLGERVVSVETTAADPPLVVRAEQSRIDADAVIVALPHDAAASVLAPGLVEGTERLASLGASPIVNAHVVYDRPVTTLAVAAALDSPAQWIFDRTASSGLAAAAAPAGGEPAGRPGGPQYLAVSVSAADDEMGRHPDGVGDQMVRELERLFPAARAARVLDVLVTKERTATFRAVPGSAAARLGPATRVPGLALAGAWTDTGWPATMEGAVRSGHAAARSAIAATGQTRLLPKEVA